jgi:hypothetical protein
MEPMGVVLQAGERIGGVCAVKIGPQTIKKSLGELEGILLYLRDTLTRKPKVGSVCGLSN